MTIVYPALDPLYCIGLNHRTAPVELRERLLSNPQALRQALESVVAGGMVNEWALLITCGRIELYVYLDSPEGRRRTELVNGLVTAAGVPSSLFDGHIYEYTGAAVVRHLCRVAAGLDSVVLGEAQILGQVNESWTAAVTTNTAGPHLKALFQTAVRAGKRARTETAIGRHPASISSLAIALAQEKAGDLRQRQVLVVGLGEMGQLALKALQARQISQVSLVNRTRARAEALAAPSGYSVYDFSALTTAVAGADVVLSAVETEQPLLDRNALQTIMSTRVKRPLVLVDLSLPRSIAPSVASLPDVHLFDLDDLRDTLDDGRASRQQEVPQVEAIVEQEVEWFLEKAQGLAVEPLISSLRQRAEAIRRQEIARTLHHLGDVDSATFNHIDHLSQALVNKLLHEPTVKLRQRAGEDHNEGYAAVVRDLFDLWEGEP